MGNKAYFITATGTGLGKTWLTASLVRASRRRGLAMTALKPIMSGFDAASVEASDAGVLRAAGGAACALDEISPWRYAAPLAPDIAAAREGKCIPFDEVVAWCRRRIENAPGLVLIEGIGGVMVPLTERQTVLDWIAALDIPAILIGGTYLGAISHTLTALFALQTAGVRLSALIVNESAQDSVGIPTTLSSLAHQRRCWNLPIFLQRRDDETGIARLLDFLLEEAR
ncbi:MAG: dethiobiotin synthase [Rhodocyclaceae bacterium]|nr:dethiobiotin synthase [Rhodocyclaceae bacterium]